MDRSDDPAEPTWDSGEDLGVHIPVAAPPAMAREGEVLPVFDPRPWRWDRFEAYVAQVREVNPQTWKAIREINGRIAGTLRGIQLVPDRGSGILSGHIALQGWIDPRTISGVQTVQLESGRLVRQHIRVPADQPIRFAPVDRSPQEGEPFNLLAPPFASRDRNVYEGSTVAFWLGQVEDRLRNLRDVSAQGKGSPTWSGIGRRFIIPAGHRMEAKSWRGYREFLGTLDPEALRKMRSMAAPSSTFYETLTPANLHARQRRMQALQVYPVLMRDAFGGDRQSTRHHLVINDVDAGRNPAAAYWEYRVDRQVDQICPAWLSRRVAGVSFQRTGAEFARNPEKMLQLVHAAGPDRFPLNRAEYAFIHALGQLYLDTRVGFTEQGRQGFRSTLSRGYPAREDGSRLELAKRLRAHMEDFGWTVSHVAESLEFHAGGGTSLWKPMIQSVLELPLEKIEGLHALESRLRNQLPPGTGPLEWPALLKAPLEVNYYRFTSLSTAADLAAEGAKHQHCVAGYANSAIAGRCEIIRAESRSLSRKDFTLEIGLDADQNLSILQARGLRNEPADSVGTREAEMLIRRIETAIREHDASDIDLGRAARMHAPLSFMRFDQPLTLEQLETWKGIAPLTAKLSLEACLARAREAEPDQERQGMRQPNRFLNPPRSAAIEFNDRLDKITF